MDANRFDQIVRFLTITGTRRRALGVLSALPLAGGLEAVLRQDAAGAKTAATVAGNTRARSRKRTAASPVHSP